MKTTEKQATIRFNRRSSREFTKELNARVRQYFSQNNIKRTGDWRLYIKTVVWLTLLVVVYITLIAQIVTGWWAIVAVVILGIVIAGIGMNIMHDANHGSFSSKKSINEFFGGVIYILGVNKNNWKVQHNILHHSYTNIHDHDEDIAIQGILRFTRFAPWFPWHRIQRIYAWFLYGLLTFKWVVHSDFSQLKRYLREGYNNGKPQQEWTNLIVAKVIYASVFITIPLLVGYPWWQVLIGFVLMHYVTGFILAVVFQLAHINPDTDVIEVDEQKFVPRSREEHQLATTANFATKNRLLTWLLGGLNYQVEHHLWPTTSHVHYPALADIVQEVCEKYQKPYHIYDRMKDALKAHHQHLKTLGVV